MAEIKKYLDTTALGTLVSQIKAEDSKILQSAKDYCDSKDKLFESAGAANTALETAKAYTDELANGDVATNTSAIATLNGDATVDGSVAKAVADAKSDLQASIDATDAIADKNAEDIASINNAESGILAQAKAFATSEDTKVQANVDAVAEDLAELDTYVGDIPSDYTETNVIAYINKKAEETLNAASGGSSESAASVLQALNAYKAGNDPKVAKNTEDIATAQAAADAAQSTADTAKASIDAFLKEADATETAIDTLKEIQAELAEGEASAASMLAEINALKAVDNATQEELNSALATVNKSIESKADKTTVDDIEDRVEALEAVDVATKVYVDQAETDAVSAAKTYSDGLNTSMNSRVEALELIDHEHSNKTVIDDITTEKVTSWNNAVSKAHEHVNATELDKIADGDVAKWNAAEQNAKNYADNLNTAMTTKVDGIGERVGTLETTIVDKADSDDLDDAVARIAQNETDISSLTSSVNSFTAITSDEVNALFA